MLHLTHSGYWAGKPICGAIRNNSDTYQHYGLTYSIKELINLCPDCKRLYEELEKEYIDDNQIT
jgi:uncharacterized protein (UPF0128 family)